jgi:hypothetical protein
MNPQAILCDEVFFIGAMALMQGAFFYKVIIVKTLGRPYWATLRFKIPEQNINLIPV